MTEVTHAQQCAEYLKALGEPVRLAIINLLRSGEKNVSEIAEQLEIELQNASHHLKVLSHSKLVTAKKKGRFVLYSLNPSFFNNESENGRFDFGCCSFELTQLTTE